MKELLTQLRDLLNQHIPEVVASLNPPASENQIKEAEEVMGFQLPNEIKELYKIHNGQSGNSGLFCGLTFLSIKEVIKEWNTWFDISKGNYSSLDANIISVPSSFIKEVYSNKFYFPISKDNRGNNISIDLDPDINGTKGQVINTGRDEEMRYVISLNLVGFIKFIIHQIENENIRVERREEYINWYIKHPSNSHFLDTLKELSLPFGHEVRNTSEPKALFGDWMNSLDTKWKELISQNCRSVSNWDELKKIKSVNLLRCVISDIKPLSEFTGLRELILTGNPLSDLSPLVSLEELKKLYLAKTSINSISEILKLSNLTQLSLYDTKINSLDGINSLTKLKVLSIESTAITDLSEIGKLKAVTELDLSKNEFSSFEPLRGLKKIRALNISNTNISELDVIKEFNRLESHTIYDTEVIDFSPLKSLDKIDRITCSYKDFLKIKDVINHKINFGISGEMTEEQKENWREYN